MMVNSWQTASKTATIAATPTILVAGDAVAEVAPPPPPLARITNTAGTGTGG
jgi:hypothetical protein